MLTTSQLKTKKSRLERIIKFLEKRVIEIHSPRRETFLIRRLELMRAKLDDVNKILYK